MSILLVVKAKKKKLPHPPFLLSTAVLLFVCGLFVLPFLMQRSEPSPELTIRYLPLGDSYTIGEGVAETERFPNQLVKRLEGEEVSIEFVDNPARSGATTQDLIEQQLPVFDRTDPDIVTVLIGVNDWVRGVSVEKYQANLDQILEHLTTATPQPKIVMVTLPNFAVTPAGEQYTSGRNGPVGILEYNSIISETAAKYNLPVVDIFSLSTQMGADPTLVHTDQLHPSAKEYGLWVDEIYPVFWSQLK